MSRDDQLFEDFGVDPPPGPGGKDARGYNPPVGDMLFPFQYVLEIVVNNSNRFKIKDVEFATDQLKRFETYGERTYMSESQRKWISDLDNKVRQLGLG
jgi:hypothetical protein